MNPRQAREHLDLFEQRAGFRLAELPAAQRDLWDANVRAMAADLGVDLDDRAQANAAFAGAYLIATLVLPVAHMPLGHVQQTVAIARGFAEHADTASMLTDLQAWLTER